MKRAALLLLLAAALLAAPAASAATAPPKPTKQDRAHAKALVAAAKTMQRNVDAATDRYVEGVLAALEGCAPWAELDEELHLTAFDLLEDVFAADASRALLPEFRAYAATLAKLKPKDPALRAGHALVLKLVRDDLAAGYHLFPAADFCALVTAWAEAEHDEGFDFLAAAGMDAELLATVFADRPLTPKQRRTLTALANRLVACGVAKVDAARFRP